MGKLYRLSGSIQPSKLMSFPYQYLKIHGVFLFMALLSLFANKAGAENPLLTPFEKSGNQSTASYEEGISYYKELAVMYPSIEMVNMGLTDAGYPLHLVSWQADRSDKSRLRLLIMNAIHPGEPDGVDASMILLRNIINGTIDPELTDNLSLYIIPYYNIGGTLNRGSFTRINQNGPEEKGFRGNARNYDLNRDFIKMDTRNAWSFADLFHQIDPDLFIDTHTSNGADYQYTITCLETHPDQLGGKLGNFLSEELRPAIFRNMASGPFDICPFVNVYSQPPDKGFSKFLDGPHYSTGYTALFNTIGFMAETHMLKPFEDRVFATYHFLKSVIEESIHRKALIQEFRKEDRAFWMNREKYILSWTPDLSNPDMILFRGYEAEEKMSEITGQPRLYYNRSRPYEKEIPYYARLVEGISVPVPRAYLVPFAWKEVIERLAANQIEIDTVKKDSHLKVESYRILSYDTYDSPYEGHYPHYNTEVSKSESYIMASPGDYIIYTRQKGIRYILETLEPSARDSFFNWNFFDSILMRKEGFSSYVFEDLAPALIENQPWIADSLAFKRRYDQDFAQNGRAQLDYIYSHSLYAENSYMQYPIYRLTE